MNEDLHVAVTSEAESKTKLDVTIRDHSAVVDEPSDFGGNNEGPNPLEYMFTGLAGCMNVTLHHVAKEKGIDIESLEINIEGDIDLQKFMNGSGDRAGFQNLNVEISMGTDSDAETERELIDEAEERCPVSDNIRNPTQIDVSEK